MTTARLTRAMVAVFGVLMALVLCGPSAGSAHAAAAAPAGDGISIGDPDSLGQIDLYVDPLCPFSGKFVREQGDAIGKHIDDGTLHVNLRFVNFLEKRSASGTYDARAIYAAFVVADQARSSDVAWRYVQQLFSAEHQPEEHGPADLSNDQLADLAGQVRAPQPAQDLIRAGLPIGFDSRVIAHSNLVALHEFPKPGVPMVIRNGQQVDTDTDWLGQLPA